MINSSQRNRRQMKLISIYIRLHNGNGKILKISPFASVSMLINKINLLDLQLPNQYLLMANTKYLTNPQKSLVQYQVIENTIIHIYDSLESYQKISRSHSKIDVCIHFQGQKYIVKVKLQEKVLQLKKDIYKVTKILPKDQCLIFNGLILKNSENLASYKIKNDSLICLHKHRTRTDEQNIIVDQNKKTDRLIDKESNLLDSSQSQNLCLNKQYLQKTALFRSDSRFSLKNSNVLQPYEIQIHQKIENQDDQVHRQFNYSLFSSILQSSPSELSAPDIRITAVTENPLNEDFMNINSNFLNPKKGRQKYQQYCLVTSLVNSNNLQ